MKKIAILAVAAMTAAVSFAELSNAFVNTTGANGETSGDVGKYAAYLCTVEAARTYFGGYGTAGDITGYMADNVAAYNAGMNQLRANGDALSPYGYDDGEYSFVRQYQQGTLGDGGYIAVVTYAGGAGEDDMFRVFESMASGGVLEFDPASGSGTAGSWTAAAAVPEPTSGLLLLLGLAGLALRRRRA